MLLVDSHCHLDMLDFSHSASLAAEVEAVLARARARGVGHFLCVNVDPARFNALAELVAPYQDVSLSLGLHPLYQLETPLTDEQLLEMAAQDQVVALGETGLDYYHQSTPVVDQQRSFQQHLNIALAVNKPVIVHTRSAGADTLALLRPFCERGGEGVIHCFTEDLDFARQAIGMGLYISFSGIVTFNSARDLREVAQAVPLDRLLVETDTPYLAPVPFRGQQNEPGYVREVAEFIAQLRGISLDFFAQQTSENFFRLFSGVRPTGWIIP